ncbi:hypothetical protein PAHAL_5G539000 [Panicum hallii]|uniref:NAC domain-containing protein n=1 Tax=Panicum hallii TaxID=206008 RepID=A0A2S3HZJ8_9POAL|nr:hypothetical protein PAHAL_5G539000 [Panicum hallii]
MEAAAAAAGGGSSSSLVFRGCPLPPGFRFQPTDQEIIVYYLKKKIAAAAAAVTSIIADVDIYKFDPWELPADKAVFGDGEWFFFSPRDRKYPNGARPNRTAGSGYWKATGTDKPILAPGGAHCLGVKKALVFYQGRSPKGTKTEWVMHEYRLLDTDAALLTRPPTNSMRLDDWVLCRVRKKQHGVDDWVHYSSSPSEPTTTTTPTRNAAVVLPPAEAVVPLPPATATYDAGIDWMNSDGQLLHYLIGGHGAGAGAGSGSPPPDPSAGASAHPAGDSAPPHSSLVSVLETIKRNLSFQAIDELYLLQPSKRANCMMVRGDDEQTSSFSVSEADDEVFF